MRYIGSKARIVDEIMRIAGPPIEGSRFVDAFCGTGSVAEAAAQGGWPIHLNDHLRSAVTVASARLIGQRDVDFSRIGSYEDAVNQLQSAPETNGFVWREYSPASRESSSAGVERKYFTEENAQRIDGARRLIRSWSDDSLISSREESLLLGDLLLAANRVANISGTYGCFLRDWQKSSLSHIEFEPRELPPGSTGLTSSCTDVSNVVSQPDDLVYLDPPYTKRQYAAYYHILETICIGDEPNVSGKTGLRPWHHLASPFCYKRKALGALTQLIKDCKAERILLSYSDEGHVDLDELRGNLESTHVIQVHEIGSIGRYRPNQMASTNRDSVSEFLVEIRKTRTQALSR
jgi:adenine-specific DNA-methyltransferase